MANYGNQTGAFILEETERETFFRILLHDDRNSFYFVSTDASGIWTEKSVRKHQLAILPLSLKANYYFSRNGFNGSRRKVERARQLNALFFDLDCHDADSATCDSLINEALDRITDAAARDMIPQPNLIVHSGRGLHLYYVLSRSVPYRLNASILNEKALNFFSDIQERLANIFEQLLGDIQGIDVDRKVFDFTRVARIPGTFNVKANRFARLISANETYYQLGDFSAYCKKTVQKTPAVKRGAKMIKFDSLMMSRLHKIEALQEHRGIACAGHRETMAFVYYNTAVQIYEREDAKRSLALFNEKFIEPLDRCELDGIERSVDRVVNVKRQQGYYVLSAKKVVQLLGLTEKEMLDTNFFASKRMASRIEAKRSTQEKRDVRNNRIAELAKQKSMTRKQIAEAVGCSLRTVQSVLKALGLTSSVPAKVDTAQATHKTDENKVQIAMTPPLISSFSECANFWLTCLKGVNTRTAWASLCHFIDLFVDGTLFLSSSAGLSRRLFNSFPNGLFSSLDFPCGVPPDS